MKKLLMSVALSMVFAGSLQAREQARAGASTIVGRFNDGMGLLFKYTDSSASLAAAQICVLEVYADWAGTYIDIIEKTPNLNSSDISTFLDLYKKFETARSTMAEFDELFGPEVRVKVKLAMNNKIESGQMPGRAADQPITLADVKEEQLKSSFKVCASDEFVGSAKSDFETAYLSQVVSYDRSVISSNDISWIFNNLGGISFEAISNTIPTKLTRADFLRKNMRRFN